MDSDSNILIMTRDSIWTEHFVMVFLGGSDSEESACNARDLCSNSQRVKNSPEIQEMQVRSLGRKDLLEKVGGNLLQYSYLKNSTGGGA